MSTTEKALLVTNPVKTSLIEIAAGAKAGDDVTDAINSAGGNRGTGISFGTLARWVEDGLVRKTKTPAGSRYKVTAKGVREAIKSQRLQNELAGLTEAERRARARALRSRPSRRRAA